MMKLMEIVFVFLLQQPDIVLCLFLSFLMILSLMMRFLCNLLTNLTALLLLLLLTATINELTDSLSED